VGRRPLAKEGAARFNPVVASQQTLREACSYEGTGLHSGNRVRMTWLPAPPGTGIRFRRVDLEGRPEIEAWVDNVTETTRSTTLSKGNVKVHTVEHLLAAFAGYGIDNAIVELDANEPPIGDGSARHFCQLMSEAGVQPQAEEREVLRVTTPLELTAGESLMTVFPHDRLKITCTSSDREGRFTQYFSLEITPETWERELAHARTFCFFDELEQLIRNGLIRGGSLENAVVIRGDAVLTTEPLRYPDEFVRHKILDVLGDLSLVGRPLLGHVLAVKPGHALNCELARRLASQFRRTSAAEASFRPPPLRSEGEQARIGEAPLEVYGIQQLLKVLPHRYPFLMVDRITHLEEDKASGLKNVTINEPYFQGHFPGHPIMPGVLQLEAIAQVAGILMLNQPENSGKPAYFMSAEKVKWRKPVRPGDVLKIDVHLTRKRGRIGRATGVCTVDGEPVSEAEVTFMVVDE
jgi:UDP-3-O-[3-hydroxymyristoyl] N-acetylglucosamine deacetylase / 3-hydroxyacyl-[acyl-carrier-protein] dehydratase